MIKIIITIWLVAIHAFAFLAMWDTDLPYRIDRTLGTRLLNPPEITTLYEDMLGSHQQLDGSVKPGSVIFLGDSLTQGLNVAAVANNAINYGIGMDSSVGLLRRIPSYPSLKQASTVVIAIGINDLLRAKRSPKAIIKNYHAILNHLSTLASNKRTIIVQAVFPVDEQLGLTGLNKQIVQLNQQLQTLAIQRGYPFINLYDQFTNHAGQLKPSLHIGDGIHLNNNGYRLWIRALKQEIATHSN
ncbi:MAG: GDSL-type esterase/lipase family protein [Leucothrix sp.]